VIHSRKLQNENGGRNVKGYHQALFKEVNQVPDQLVKECFVMHEDFNLAETLSLLLKKNHFLE